MSFLISNSGEITLTVGSPAATEGELIDPSPMISVTDSANRLTISLFLELRFISLLINGRYLTKKGIS